MTQWHETRAANIGLRLAGLLLIGLVSMAGHYLFERIQQHLQDELTPFDMMLAAITVLVGSAGCLLLFDGPGLWQQVRISDRWAHRLPGPVPREFEGLLDELASSKGGSAIPKGRSQKD
jgi:hypothetical protein